MTSRFHANGRRATRSFRQWVRIALLFGLAGTAPRPGTAADESLDPEPETANPVRLQLPRTGLEPAQLAVIVNDANPLSVQTAAYYRDRRGIPDGNIIHVKFRSGTTLTREAFDRIKQEVDARTPPGVQAYALAWTAPYRVDCMSITSAFALGFDPAYCSKQCATTRPSGYLDSSSTAPYKDHRIRPAMMLAGQSFAQVKALIDRGIASDATYPTGTGYLVKTSDQQRSVRAQTFVATAAELGKAFRLEQIDGDFIRDKDDVLFYFTGLVKVPHLDTLHFLPGAVADHLTSTGGKLTGGNQMSSLEWLNAGATGSYGAVVEPCNHLQKFPFPALVMAHYAAGATLIEAYWKSVACPGEGVFIGEPLARPYPPQLMQADGTHARVRLFAPLRRELGLERSDSPVGPYRLTAVRFILTPGMNDLDINLPDDQGFFRLTYDLRPPAAAGAGRPSSTSMDSALRKRPLERRASVFGKVGPQPAPEG